jgi:hypothetical protein
VHKFQINFVYIPLVFLGDFEIVSPRKNWEKIYIYNCGALKTGRNFCETKNFLSD